MELEEQNSDTVPSPPPPSVPPPDLPLILPPPLPAVSYLLLNILIILISF